MYMTEKWMAIFTTCLYLLVRLVVGLDEKRRSKQFVELKEEVNDLRDRVEELLRWSKR